ncbi:dephospho-CoA kinase [Paenilisteria rocourtiae]|uniref:Dephospho-CoA kinase n=1 Tax=Listeria rocourtiae TaxID=647910 RepID=A0A4R6ZM75_9LIST|nr:dephospho-CoA kinase [Listeria rocourtiae]EUJ44923.1 dephospho-CoA kinase [Listeria rocourtiae FSL F6-920]MBC1434408.1 dephospho-CoA kinase [Listeria rocourtiae]TDR53561.1 dephospho-CoA kinase [Listeria rocourtiae]
MAYIIGLTGGIASGKSTVSKMFHEAGFPIVDADIAARKVVEKDTEGARQLRAIFGAEVFQEDGELNRQKLGGIIFHDSEKREALNAVVHPLVRQWMLSERDRLIASGHAVIVFDIPLLIESKLQGMVDTIIVVYVDEKTQLDRLMERNDFSKSEAKARIASQMPLTEKISYADIVIDNSHTLDETKQQVNELIQTFLK